MTKNATPQEVLITINEVASKGFYYTDYVMKIIQDDVLTTKKTKSSFGSNFLSPRESEVLKLICLQKSTVEIADQLFITPRTVKGYRNNLLLKTESRNIAGLVFYAVQNSLLLLNE